MESVLLSSFLLHSTGEEESCTNHFDSFLPGNFNLIFVLNGSASDDTQNSEELFCYKWCKTLNVSLNYKQVLVWTLIGIAIFLPRWLTNIIAHKCVVDSETNKWNYDKRKLCSTKNINPLCSFQFVRKFTFFVKVKK